VPVSFEEIPKFRLPEEKDRAIIMIAAGTGVAPFRGFLQERKRQGAKGNNWLIFGERNKKTDFLYGKELLAYKSKGFLTELDTAFSRDSKKKVYVSHIIEQKADKILEWLAEGAIIYVCGSKDNLAKSVRKSLVNIFAKHLNSEDALERFESIKSNKQYLEEVY